MAEAAVALGSNLRDPARQVRAALDELAELPHTVLKASSRLYRTAPVGGPPEQPDFCNAVAMLETGLDPGALLEELQAIERAHDRRREQHWGPRTLDLDLLTHGREIRSSDRLSLPHPRLAERAFVLMPWREIAADLEVPGLGTVGALAQRVDPSGVRPWDHD